MNFKFKAVEESISSFWLLLNNELYPVLTLSEFMTLLWSKWGTKFLPSQIFFVLFLHLFFPLKLFSLPRLGVSLLLPSVTIVSANDSVSLHFLSWAHFGVHFFFILQHFCSVNFFWLSIFSSHVLTLILSIGAHHIISLSRSLCSLSHLALSALQDKTHLIQIPQIRGRHFLSRSEFMTVPANRSSQGGTEIVNVTLYWVPLKKLFLFRAVYPVS